MPLNHAPNGYQCPFCMIVAGEEGRATATIAAEVIERTDMATAFIASKQLLNNLGHVLVIPNQHFENLYSLPDEFAVPLQSLTRRIAIAMKHAYGCDGISLRQHNEPGGGQDVWHYHIHIYPRYRDDEYFPAKSTARPIAERVSQAALVRNQLALLGEQPVLATR
ncbi:MAG: HIT family protein [Proteobacteria bacterium]|nr:HIT family protein [Pseudomonadota bacterium]MDA1300533.1 HIT family protein [Pseudomonadota bacterium]